MVLLANRVSACVVRAHDGFHIGDAQRPRGVHHLAEDRLRARVIRHTRSRF